MAQQVLEGTWEEIQEHEAELSGKRVRVIVLSAEEILPKGEHWPPNTVTLQSRRAMGRYAHVPGTSKDFLRDKELEIAREDKWPKRDLDL